MSQTKFPKLTVKNRPNAEGKISVGANVDVRLDDKPLGNLSFLKIEIKAARIAKVTMEMYVEVDVDINTPPLQVIKEEETEYELNGKPLVMKTLGNYTPVGIATKKLDKKSHT